MGKEMERTMGNKNFFKVFCLAAILITLFVIKINAQDPCPTFVDLLDKGWTHIPGQDPHTPTTSNKDEFGTVDSEPFIIKVNDYPPVKSFPIIPFFGCSGSTFYYFSFDTDNDYLPINYKMPRNQPNFVKTYKVDQNGTYTSGYSVVVIPPDGPNVGNTVPDFVMKYDGTLHDVAWNEEM